MPETVNDCQAPLSPRLLNEESRKKYDAFCTAEKQLIELLRLASRLIHPSEEASKAAILDDYVALTRVTRSLYDHSVYATTTTTLIPMTFVCDC